MQSCIDIDQKRHYVGQLQGESNIEQTKFLPKTFIETPAIKLVARGNCCFVCGRRGAGKTAIATVFTSSSGLNGKNKYFDIGIKVVKSDYEVLQSTLVQELTRIYSINDDSQLETLYFYAWRFILDLLTIQLLTHLDEDDQQEIEQATMYLKSICPSDISPVDSTVGIIEKSLRKNRDSTLPITTLTIDMKMLCETKIHKQMMRLVWDKLKKIKTVIAIDSRDIYDMQPNGLSSWRGMCRAVKEYTFNSNLNKTRVLAFLPAELTVDLFKNHLVKYQEFAVYLSWSYSDLLALLCERYCIYLDSITHEEIARSIRNGVEENRGKGIHKNVHLRDRFWHVIADAKIRNHPGWLEDSFSYLVRHTQKRPREIISCVNYIIKESYWKKSAPHLTEDSIRDGIHDRENLYRLLSDNLSAFNLQQGDSQVSDLAAKLIANEHTVFPEKDFSQFVQRALPVISTEDNLSVPDVKRLLLRSGLIGVVVRNKGNDAHIWFEPGESIQSKYYVTEFEYLISGHIAINDKSLFAVHPILSNRLRISAPEDDTGIVYPLPESSDLVTQLSKVPD